MPTISKRIASDINKIREQGLCDRIFRCVARIEEEEVKAICEGLYGIINYSVNERDVDVIFVHGLTGSWDRTWSHGDLDACWMKSIGKLCQHYGVFSHHYETERTDLGKQLMTIEELGQTFLEILRNSIGHTQDIMLIGHSMGGLVIKEMLRSAASLEHVDLCRRIKHIVFIATPHGGSSFANLANLPGLQTFASDQVRNLADDAYLSRLSQSYLELSQRFEIATTAYYETKPFLAGRRIVDKADSDPKVPGCVPVPINKNHSDIAKCTHADIIYRNIAAWLSSHYPAVAVNC